MCQEEKKKPEEEEIILSGLENMYSSLVFNVHVLPQEMSLGEMSLKENCKP